MCLQSRSRHLTRPLAEWLLSGRMRPDEWENLLGRPVAAVEHAGWGFTNRTEVLTLDSGDRAVVQWYADRRAAAHRLDATRQLAPALLAEGVPTPVLLRADLDADPPHGLYEALPGEPGYVIAGHDLSAPGFPAMARSMGRLLSTIQDIPVDAVALPAVWAEPHRLTAAADQWLASIAGLISTADRRRLGAVIESLPVLFAQRPAVVAHGDFGPANVLFQGSRITGLLDLESARLADPLLDVAWWKWLLHAHTPRAFERSWAAFLTAAGVDSAEPEFEHRLHALLLVRLLETAAQRAGPDWGRRVSLALDTYALP